MLLSLPDRAWDQVLSGLDVRDTLVLEHVSSSIRQRQQRLSRALTCRLRLAQLQYPACLRQTISNVEAAYSLALQNAVGGRVCRNDYLSVHRALGSMHNLDQQLARRSGRLLKRYRPLLSPGLDFTKCELLCKQKESAMALAAARMANSPNLCNLVEA